MGIGSSTSHRNTSIQYYQHNVFTNSQMSTQLENLPYDTIDQGSFSGFSKPLMRTYRTRKQFKKFWKKHTSDIFPPPRLPPIDFQSSMVLVAFRGEQFTGGYKIKITSIKDTADEIIVKCLNSDPSPWVLTGQVLTQPFHIVNITASDKPVRYVVTAKSPPEKPFPKFMITFEDGVDDFDLVMEDVEQCHGVNDTSILRGIGIGMVEFDSKNVTEEQAQTCLESIDGVEYVEADYSGGR